jgi:glutaredoxin 3
MVPIEIYSTPSCPFCLAAKRLLVSKGATWTEVDVAAEPERRQEMMRRSGRPTVPQIWITGRHVGGFDDLAVLDATGELDRMLDRG